MFIVSKPQLGHHRVDLQRLRDHDGTLIPDGVVPEVEGGHHRHARLEGVGDGLGTLVADFVETQEVQRPGWSGPR